MSEIPPKEYFKRQLKFQTKNPKAVFCQVFLRPAYKIDSKRRKMLEV